MKTQSKYVVYVINKWNNEEALSHLEFDTLEEAMSIAQHIILRSFSQEGKEGYEEWVTAPRPKGRGFPLRRQ